ncbi:unnamed protein product [Closterium sp. NIES-53]
MFQHIKDLVELDDSGPKAWKLFRDVIQPNTLPMVIVLEKELAALSMRPGDDVKPVLDKIKDTYARMAAVGSNVSQMQQCTKIISVLDNSWDSLIPTLNTQQDQWIPEWLRQQILQEDFRRRHTGGGAANKTAEGYGAVGGSRGRGGGRGRGRGRGFGRGRGRGDYNEGHGSSGGRGSTRMEGACWYCKKAGHPWFKCFSRPEGWAPPGMKLPSGERARGGVVQGSGAQGDGAHSKADPGMFLMVEDVKGSEGDVGSVGKVVMNPLTHWVIDSGCTSHMTPRADLLDEVKPPGKIKFVAAASAQRESGHKVKVIRTDNEGEFIGADFEAVLKKKGIQHQLTVPYNPQQNGVAERFNRILQEGARTLLGRAGLPDPFWVIALWQVALVKNKVLATLGDKQWVPYTKWYGSVPAVNMLRAYGCMVVFYVPKEKRQVQVTVSDKEISGVTEVGEEPEVEEQQQQQQQQQQDAPPRTQRPRDRPSRDVRPPNRLTYPSFGKPKVVRAGSVAEQCDEDEIAHCYWAAVLEPKTLAEALSGPDAEKWKQSVKEEYDSLLENETWELCELPPGKKAISFKLIFRHKYGPDGELTPYKSRLVAKGLQLTKGKDFDEIFAPVGKGTTLRVMLGTAANRGWRIKQMDITTAFLNGIILEELYMLQLEGLDDGSGRVCRLKKAIYGLKQAPRAWYRKLEETLLARGFKKSECDHSLFLLQEKEQFLMLLVYVDDILLFSKSAAMIERVEEMLEMQFKCSKMGDVKYYLGMHVERDLDKGVLRLHQRKYCEGLAEKYGLQDGGNPATPLPLGFIVEPCADEEVVGESDKKLFHSMVGALNYVANRTRPDIAFATSRLASVVSRPSHEQLEAAKRLVRYVSATASVDLEYSAVRQRLQRGAPDLSKGEMLLTCYTDASFNSVKVDGTSIGGYVCFFGGGAVSWRSKKQNEVGLSSCETEYMALHHGVKEVVWLRRLLEEIGVCQRGPAVMRLLDKEVRLEIVKTQQQAADILTKRLAENENWKGMKLAGMSVH